MGGCLSNNAKLQIIVAKKKGYVPGERVEGTVRLLVKNQPFELAKLKLGFKVERQYAFYYTTDRELACPRLSLFDHPDNKVKKAGITIREEYYKLTIKEEDIVFKCEADRLKREAELKKNAGLSEAQILLQDLQGGYIGRGAAAGNSFKANFNVENDKIVLEMGGSKLDGEIKILDKVSEDDQKQEKVYNADFVLSDGQTRNGILSFGGEFNERLVIAWARPGMERPTEFRPSRPEDPNPKTVLRLTHNDFEKRKAAAKSVSNIPTEIIQPGEYDFPFAFEIPEEFLLPKQFNVENDGGSEECVIHTTLRTWAETGGQRREDEDENEEDDIGTINCEVRLALNHHESSQ